MALDHIEERQQAHALLDLLPPSKLGAVRNLLEVFLDEGGDTLSPAEAEADEWSKHNEPIPHEKVLADFGLREERRLAVQFWRLTESWRP
jgi:hypothetical protein